MVTNVLPCSRNKLKTIVLQLYLPATFSYHNCPHSDYSENVQYCKKKIIKMILTPPPNLTLED
ncbi:hypothetical protein GBA52_028146 [Prunus armeniaca]|nr:hypothetical protein GBA52_028146 [Prunus armeniaca]